MKVVKIEPKDIYVTLEMSIQQIGMLLHFLSMCQVLLDKNDPESVQAHDYIMNQFLKTMDQVYKEVQDGA